MNNKIKEKAAKRIAIVADEIKEQNLLNGHTSIKTS